MNHKRLFSMTVLVFSVLFISQTGNSLYTGKVGQDQLKYAPDRIIVKLRPEANSKVVLGKVGDRVTTGISSLDRLNSKFSVLGQKKLFGEFKRAASNDSNLSSIYILEVPSGTDIDRMKAEYENLPGVEFAEPDYRVSLFDAPNDPLFPHQWYLNNTGQGYYGIDRSDENNHRLVTKFGTFDADIDALEAWERNDQTVVPLVGIIDTGVDLDHEDLQANIYTNPGEIPNNGIDDDHNGFTDDFYGWDFAGGTFTPIVEDNDPTDTYGHGTHCAGIVASVRNNGIGVSGINTPCRIMAIKTFPDYSGGTHFSVCAKGIVYAADMGCDIINMSWGAWFSSRLVKEALDYAVDRGVLPVTASGNDGIEKYNYPASYGNVFTVGASNSHDQVTHFSTYSESLDVVAPGEDILSLRANCTDMYGDCCGGGTCPDNPTEHVIPYPDGHYYLADGTSMASPCAVGVAAYILAASPGISNDSVIAIMERSADDILYPYGDSTLPPLHGKDIYSGYGRVNLNSALALISGRLAQITYPYENALVSGNVAILGTAAGANFNNYSLEYGQGYSPTEWFPITSSNTPVINDTLAIWNSSGLIGLYTLRLTVGDQNQALVHVIANSGTYVGITLPNENDTIKGVAQIKGYTIVPDFSNYKLEYGLGESPSDWETIRSSTKMVVDGILGSWLVSLLEEGDYTLRLTVKNNSGDTFTDSILVYVKSITSGGWVAELSGSGSLSPAVGDVDGDGLDEIVVGIGDLILESGNTGGVEVFSDSGQLEPGWPKDTDKNMMSSPVLGDLDGDGVNDIVICSDSGVHAYLSSSPSWFRVACTAADGNNLSLVTPIIADLENDGYLEVLTVNINGTVYAWRNNGDPVISGSDGVFARSAAGGSSLSFPCLAVADLDQDGENEVIAGVNNGIYIWDINGNLILSPQDYPNNRLTCVYGIAIANIDETPDLEIIVLGANQDYFTLSAFKKDGTQVTNYPIILEGLAWDWWAGNHPAIGDLNGDDSLEIVVTVWTLGEARVYGWHQDGTPLGSEGGKGLLVSSKLPDAQRRGEVLSKLGNNIGEVVAKIKSMDKEELSTLMSTLGQDPPFASEVETFGSPVLADVNGDDTVDIIARAGYLLETGYERVFAWDYQGVPIPGFPLYASDEEDMNTYLPYTPVIADIDKDGKMDMVLVTYFPNRLISWEFDASYDTSHIPWPKYMHDKWNSGRLGFKPGEGTVNLPPHNFHVQSWTENSVTLAWNPRASWLSLGYNIYRSTISGQPGEKINTSLIPRPQNQYQDLDLPLGQTYYYTITNIDTSHQESDRSKEVKITVGQPTTPTGLVAQLEGAKVTLSWHPNPVEDDVVKYRIYHMGSDLIEYQLIDSTTAETSYVDSSIKRAGSHHYRITAVDNIGLKSFPSEAVEITINSLGKPPYDLKVLSWCGLDAALSWRGYSQPCDTAGPPPPPMIPGVDPLGVMGGFKGNACGYNIYRSTYPGLYPDPPLNSVLLIDSAYQDVNLTEGVTYYYIVTEVKVSFETSPSNEVSFLAGRPDRPNLKVRSGKHGIRLHMSTSDTDIKGYKIFRKDNNGPFQVINPLCLDTIFTDFSAMPEIIYYYKAAAIDTFNLEGLPSDSAEGCIMSFSQGLVVVDMTKWYEYSGVNSDSVNAFYQRVLVGSLGYNYTYLDKDRGTLTLLELSTHPVAIVHSEEKDMDASLSLSTYQVLKQYLEAGGALLIEGRRNLSGGQIEYGFRYFGSEDFRHDNLSIDSAYMPLPLATLEFIGANRTPYMEGYPQVAEVDTHRVNNPCDRYTNPPKGEYDPEGKLTGIGYFFPVDSSDVIYTFVSADSGTSSSHGKPVALQHITDSSKVIYFDFPLWFLQESTAVQILGKALEALATPTYKAGDLTADGIVDLGDVVFLINYLYKGGSAPAFLGAADVNSDCEVNIGDLVYLITYLYKAGPPPVYGCASFRGPALAKVKEIKERVVIDVIYENGITTISSNSPIEELLGLQLELENPNQVTPLHLTGDRLDLVYGYKEGTLKIGLLDLDGGNAIPAGKHSLIQLEGKCKVVSALVCNKNSSVWSASINTGEEINIPLKFALHDNFPNPFNSQTAIEYSLAEESQVKIAIYNLLGQKVKTLVDQRQTAGRKSVIWDGKNQNGESVSSGVYFYRIEAKTGHQAFTQNKRMVLLK